MLKVGEVVNVNAANRTVRVKFGLDDGKVSSELPIGRQSDEGTWLPRLGEHVLCGMLSASEGIVICAY